jgi:hypothetical protein
VGRKGWRTGQEPKTKKSMDSNFNRSTMLWWAGPLNVHVVRQTITTIVNRGSFPKKKSIVVL